MNFIPFLIFVLMTLQKGTCAYVHFIRNIGHTITCQEYRIIIQNMPFVLYIYMFIALKGSVLIFIHNHMNAPTVDKDQSDANNFVLPFSTLRVKHI